MPTSLRDVGMPHVSLCEKTKIILFYQLVAALLIQVSVVNNL